MPVVLAYHGCNFDTAQELLGGSPFQPSTQDYDWLGAGSYFWENDPVRAFQWAMEPRLKFDRPSVVGAVIELGNCLDLTTQSGIAAVKVAYEGFVALNQKNGTPVPKNVDPNPQTLGTDGTFPHFCQALFRFPAPQPAENMSKFLPPNLPIISPFRRILIP